MYNKIDKNAFGEVPEVVHEAVLKTLDSLEEKEPEKSFKVQRRGTVSHAAIILLSFLAVSGVTVSAMGMMNLYRQRMKAMTTKQLAEYYSIAMSGETTQLSRGLTQTERQRYEQLNEEYEKEGRFPQSQASYMEEAAEYDGSGIVIDTAERKMYLPEGELSDEEILQIIDFNHKIDYSISEESRKQNREENEWKNRLDAMSGEEVEKIYLIMFSGAVDVGGSFCRRLSEEENVRYQQLWVSYEEDGVCAEEEIAVIQMPKEYTGEGAAICVEDSTFYLPAVLGDEELLQVIDMQHKAQYSVERIAEEIQEGIRAAYPKAE